MTSSGSRICYFRGGDERRQRVHQLIDRLPTPQLTAVAGLLEAMLDPVLRSLANAPLDDEPVTEEDRQCIEDGRAWLAQRGGKGIPMEEVLAEYGLKPADFPVSARA